MFSKTYGKELLICSWWYLRDFKYRSSLNVIEVKPEDTSECERPKNKLLEGRIFSDGRDARKKSAGVARSAAGLYRGNHLAKDVCKSVRLGRRCRGWPST